MRIRQEKSGHLNAMHRMKSLWLLILLMFLSGTVFSQEFFTKRFSVVDGLLSSTIYDVVQDSSGLIWCASAKGISRFDGVRWLSHNNIIGKTGYGYHYIKCDEKGVLWTVSNIHELVVSVYKENRWQTYNTGPKYKLKGSICAFDVHYKSGEPLIVIATADSGILLNEKSKWQLIHVPGVTRGGYISGMTHVGSGYYLASNRGLFRLENGVVVPLTALNNQLPAKDIIAIRATDACKQNINGQKIWLMGKRWIGYFQNEKFHPLASGFPMFLDESYPSGVICASESGNIYFGNRFQLYFCTEQNPVPQKIGRDEGLAGEGALALMVDREKNTWIGGLRGLTCIPFTRFINMSSKDGLHDNEVSSALEIRPGQYVFGHDGAVTFYDGKKCKVLQFDSRPEGITHESKIQDMYLDSSENVWMACAFQGLGRISPNGQVTWYNHLFRKNERIVTVTQSKDGKLLVGGVAQLYVYEKGKFINANTGSFKVLGIRKLFNGRDDRIYIGTYSQGLLEWHNGTIVQFHAPGNQQANNVFGFCEDSKGNRWVGSSDGLYLLQGREYKKADFVGLPPDRSVYLIMEDQFGVLWIGTDDGVFRWNGKFLRHFTVRDGLAGPDINRDAGFIDSRGDIWFGTNQGITRIHNDFVTTLAQIPPPKIILDSLITPENSHLLIEERHIPYGENNLEFYFTSVSFLDEKRLKISCMLENFDRKWSNEMDASTRSLRYLNLPPGNYRFHIRAKNALGVWSEPVISPVIHIRFPFYLQWWFIIIIAGVLGTVAWFIFRFILNRRYSAVLEETVSRRTQELQESEHQLKKSNQSKDRFFSIIAHDLRSPFNVILGYLDLLTDKSFDFSEPEKEDILDKVKKSAHNTLGLLDNLLAWARTQKGDLKVTRTSFNISELITENILQAESVAAAKQITITSKNTVPVLVNADRDMIHTVIRNLISNAIKFTYPGGIIELDVMVRHDNYARISVRDTGCGIAPENLPKLFSIDERLATKGTRKESGTGLGLILCMEFITLNDGKIWAESEVGKGSVFYFDLKMS